MKRNFLKGISSLILSALLLISGCQKQIQEKEEISGVDEQGLQAGRHDDDDNNSCQLKHLDYGTGLTLDFKYNNKGLASEVLLSYSDGYFERHEIFYDKKGKLVKTRITSLDLPVILFDFSYSGDLITREKGYFEATHESWRDIFYKYNRKGQMSNLDDVVQDVHVKFSYNNKGYNSHGAFYFGSELYFTYDYKFNTSNKNPFLAVPGVLYGFWDFTLPYWDNRWEDNDRITLYDNGSPTVILDTDPAQTTMTTGPHNYLTSATKYDMISESFYTESMSYQNCRGRNDDLNTTPSNSKTVTGMSVITRIKKIINGHSKNMKQELQALKREILNKNKAK